MSYRTYYKIKNYNNHKTTKDFQFLGNNEYFQEMLTEFKKQGCVMDQEYNYYDFELIDFWSFIKALEKDIVNQVNSRKDINYFDFSDRFRKNEHEEFEDKDLTFHVCDIINDSTIFITANIIKDLFPFLEPFSYRESGISKIGYALIEGVKILVSAY